METELIITILEVIAAVVALLGANHAWVRKGIVIDIDKTLSPDGNHDITLISILREDDIFTVFEYGHETNIAEGDTVKFGRGFRFESYYVSVESKEGTIETTFEVEDDIALVETAAVNMIEMYYSLWKLERVDPAEKQ